MLPSHKVMILKGDKVKDNILTGIKKLFTAIAIPAIVFIIIFIFNPQRFGFGNLPVLLQQSIIPAILAWGVCFSFKAGVWDFSIGATAVLSAIIGGNLSMMMGLGIIGVIIICSLCGLIIGTITGAFYVILKIPSMIVSIGMMLILESLSVLVFGGNGVYMGGGEILLLGRFPYNAIIGLVVFIVIYVLYNYSSIGFHARAIGYGITVAKNNGIKIYKVRLLCFSIAGLCAGFYAFMTLGSAGIVKGMTNMGSMGIVFNAIMCVFVGLSLEKTVNLIVGTFIGSFTMQLLKAGVMTLGIPSILTQVVLALFLIIFMAISSNSETIEKLMLKLRIAKNPKI